MSYSSLAGPVYRFKIAGVPRDREFAQMPLGRKLDHYGKIREFKAKARSVWLSQKRRPASKAIKEAIRLYNVDQYYCCFNDSPNYKDDSFEFFYTTKQTAEAVVQP